MKIKNAGAVANDNSYAVEKIADGALNMLSAYFREHNHSGKVYDDMPDCFLVKPGVLEGKELATKKSEKLLLDDCIHRAKARNGYVSVSKFRNPKLGYYWLGLSVMPFMIGDAVSKDNKGEFFYILTKFIEYTKQHPKVYGDLTAEIESDKDIALMLNGISKMASRLDIALKIYPENMLVSFNPKWPVAEVQKLLHSHQSWSFS